MRVELLVAWLVYSMVDMKVVLMVTPTVENLAD